MTKAAEEKLTKLEENLLMVMTSIDNQVAREMQRNPAELEKHGVQKWEPYDKRIEAVSSFLLDLLGDNQIELDSVIVLSQALSKVLYIITEDLGQLGLGKVRTQYCLETAKRIHYDVERVIYNLKDQAIS